MVVTNYNVAGYLYEDTQMICYVMLPHGDDPTEMYNLEDDISG
jgi:hypothetical protein